jgi:hypothetical protein
MIVYVSRMTEYERGWGQRHDGWMIAKDKDYWIEWDLEHNNLPSAPDVYWKPSQSGPVDIVKAPLQLIECFNEHGHVWINSLDGIVVADGWNMP